MTILQVQSDGSQSGYFVFILILRIVAAVVCYNRAKELNRSVGGWAFFGFFMPLVAMIWVYCVKPKELASVTGDNSPQPEAL